MDLAAVRRAVGAVTAPRLRRTLEGLGLVASVEDAGQGTVRVALDLPEGLTTAGEVGAAVAEAGRLAGAAGTAWSSTAAAWVTKCPP